MRRYLAESGLEAASLQGTGPHGMLLKGDVLNAMKSGSPTTRSPPAAPAKPAAPPAAKSPGLPASTDLGYTDTPNNPDSQGTFSSCNLSRKQSIQLKDYIVHFFLVSDRLSGEPPASPSLHGSCWTLILVLC